MSFVAKHYISSKGVAGQESANEMNVGLENRQLNIL